MENSKRNKKIAINTVVIYARMAIVILVGLLTTRYVLQALGISDYGLYNVLGGIVTMLNIIGIAMHTTTRRYINVEIGKGDNGNLNKIFNISVAIHAGFAIILLFVAMSIGVWYIFIFLNINPDKLNDALFVFILSTITACLNLIMIPYQGLMTALEEFLPMSLMEVFSALLKIPFVVLLFVYSGNILCFYAVGMCIVTSTSFILMTMYCFKYHFNIVKPRFYNDKPLFKEMLAYNNYTTIGAAAYLSRGQGSTIIINYFFGTITNGAFAIASQIEHFVIQFVNNLNTAANPQLTQYYASNNVEYAFKLMENVSRYSIYIMLLLVFPIWAELDAILYLWLGQIPEQTLTMCQWMLISLFLRSITAGVDPIIQATGKIKWYQISASTLLLIGLPLSFCFFMFGCKSFTIIIVFMLMDLLYKIVQFYFLYRLTGYKFERFWINVYSPVSKILIALFLYLALYSFLVKSSVFFHLLGYAFTFVFTLIVLFVFGLKENERKSIVYKLIRHDAHII